MLDALVPHPSIMVVAWVENVGCAERKKEATTATAAASETNLLKRAGKERFLKSAAHIERGFKLSPATGYFYYPGIARGDFKGKTFLRLLRG